MLFDGLCVCWGGDPTEKRENGDLWKEVSANGESGRQAGLRRRV